MRTFVAKITTYMHFCHANHTIRKICALLLQKSQHIRIQLLCIIDEFCTLVKKIVHCIILHDSNKSWGFDWHLNKFLNFSRQNVKARQALRPILLLFVACSLYTPLLLAISQLSQKDYNGHLPVRLIWLGSTSINLDWPVELIKGQVQ